MRLLSARWVLGLAIVISVGYGLNRGILVGSRIETARLSDDYPVPFYKKHCRYLFFNGIQQVWTSSEFNKRRSGTKLLCRAERRALDSSPAKIQFLNAPDDPDDAQPVTGRALARPAGIVCANERYLSCPINPGDSPGESSVFQIKAPTAAPTSGATQNSQS